MHDVDVLAYQLNKLWDSPQPADRELIAKLQTAYRALSDPAQQRRAQTEITALERQMSLRDTAYLASAQAVTVRDLQARMEPDEIYVEIVAYRPDGLTPTDDAASPEQYRAYLLRAQGEVEAVDLGARRGLDALAERWRSELNRRQSQADPQHKLARRLHRILFAPLQPFLGSAKRLSLVTDGALQVLNFGALVDRQGRYVIERYAVRNFTSGRERLAPQTISPHRPMVFAPLRFTHAQDVPSLMNTRRETQTFQSLYPSATVLWEENATEAGAGVVGLRRAAVLAGAWGQLSTL